MIAQGAEAKVYYKEGDPSVAKERTSIYSTTNKALEAIALHNHLFPETAMRVIGFTRDSDNLLRIVLTQPYIRCQRLATKEEIDAMVAEKGFHDNWQGQGVNYISERLALEDMHPANVFIDELTGMPTCIDCIVKFVTPKWNSYITNKEVEQIEDRYERLTRLTCLTSFFVSRSENLKKFVGYTSR